MLPEEIRMRVMYELLEEIDAEMADIDPPKSKQDLWHRNGLAQARDIIQEKTLPDFPAEDLAEGFGDDQNGSH